MPGPAWCCYLMENHSSRAAPNSVESRPSSVSGSAAFSVLPKNSVEFLPSSVSASPALAAESARSACKESATLPLMPFFHASCVSFALHVWPPSALMMRSVPVLLSQQAVMVPSALVMAATAAPLQAIRSTRSATPIAGVGLGILPNMSGILLIFAHYSVS